MAKLYSKKKNSVPIMKPKEETISFLLEYSKSLKFFNTKIGTIEIIVN